MYNTSISGCLAAAAAGHTSDPRVLMWSTFEVTAAAHSSGSNMQQLYQLGYSAFNHHPHSTEDICWNIVLTILCRYITPSYVHGHETVP